MNLILKICVLVMVVIGTGCQSSSPALGIDLRSGTRFDYEWRRYLDLAPFKSIAVAGDLASNHVVGIAYAYPIPALATRAALSYCEERRADRGIEAPCQTYAIGDEPINPAVEAP